MAAALGTLLVVAGLLAMGAILGGYIVWRQYRARPTNDQLRLINAIYQRKSDDYKSLCKDAITQATTVSVLAQAIHANAPSESSSKIIAELDNFIELLHERLSAKSFTPADGVRIP